MTVQCIHDFLAFVLLYHISNPPPTFPLKPPTPPHHTLTLDRLTLPARSKDLIKLILRPPDIWAEARKLPHTLDLLIPVRIEAVRISLQDGLTHAAVLVALVRHPQLVVACDFRVGDFLPFGAADEMLRAQQGVAEDFWVGCLQMRELERGMKRFG